MDKIRTFRLVKTRKSTSYQILMLFLASDVKVLWKCQSLVYVLSAYHCRSRFKNKFPVKLIIQDVTGGYVDINISKLCIEFH